MSTLTVTGSTGAWSLNVVSFSSGLYSLMGGTQIRQAAVWFPIKPSQPEVTFDVVFRTEAEFQNFQNWVRSQQELALTSTELITLYWPERNILNWTGTIDKVVAGGMRFNVAPRMRFTVALIDSLVTSRTFISSFINSWQYVYGLDSPSGVMSPPTPQQLVTLAKGIATGAGL